MTDEISWDTKWESQTEEIMAKAKIKNSLYQSMTAGDIIAFKDGEELTPQKFLDLSLEDSQNVNLTLTEKGKKEIDSIEDIPTSKSDREKIIRNGITPREIMEIKDKELVKISEQVYNTIYQWIKAGEVIFAGEQLDADVWFRMTPEEKEKHPFKWKENTNPMMESIMKQMVEKDTLIRDIKMEGDKIIFNLTPEAERLKLIGELMGIDVDLFFETITKRGINKRFSSFVWIDKDRKIEGYSRLGGKL